MKLATAPWGELPIAAILPDLKGALRECRSVVLQAPPGAGKSTVVPLALLEEPWLRGKRLLMLEPRRLAARSVAARMAQTLREPVGRTVGYRMRQDTRVSAQTRIEVVTEGVLTGLLHADPALEDVGCVIFDEFHERSLQADLGLALCLDVQAHLHDSLRLLVMSATLAAEAVARLLDDAPVLRTEGRSFPVEIRYVEGAYSGTKVAAVPGPRELALGMAAAVRRALAEEEGDVLAFLPGAGEIRRTQELLQEDMRGEHIVIAPLYGDMTREAQELALRPAARRKVVLATNIAETSLTIEGVRVVIDSGLERRSRFDPASAMSRLDTVRISQASAQQRCGRAGRLAPGVCYRLWSAGVQQTLEAHTPAEILQTDLAPLALELAGWNLDSPEKLRWLDAPPAAAYAQARDLLRHLGALDPGGRMTALGRQMLGLRMHPRIARMLLGSVEPGLWPLACDVAALLTERDILRSSAGERNADLRVRLDLLRGERSAFDTEDRGAVQRVRAAAQQYRAQMGRAQPRAGTVQSDEGAAVGELLALAYPDRIGRARPGGAGRYRLTNGRGAFFAEPQSLAREEFLAIAEVQGGERESRIFLAAPLSRTALLRAFKDEIRTAERIDWDPRQEAVVAVREHRLGELVLEERVLQTPDEEAVRGALLRGIREMSLEALPWTPSLRQWQARVRFVGGLAQAPQPWPDVSDGALLDGMEYWLAPWVDGMSRRAHLRRLDLGVALHGLLDWNQHKQLEELAPAHIVAPSGSRVPIDYLDGEIPVLSVRLQEVFGWSETPCIGAGATPLLIKLLSPARRPVQVTRDLASFWRTGYQQVRKELKGRYPKHYWPDDPRSATPVRGVRRPSRSPSER